MAANIAQTVVQARFVQQDVQTQVLNEHESISRFSVFVATVTRKSIVFINKWVNPIYVWN
jgi:hypothetical protein